MGRMVVRILLVVGGVVLALVLLLAGSLVVDRALASGRVAAVTNVRIPNMGGPDVGAYIARPSTPGPHPAVIMIHEFWGLNEEIVGKAQALAQEGYVVVAPDTFRGSSTSWVPSAILQVASTPVAQIDRDLDSVFAWTAAQTDVRPDRIVIMGFCYGGGAALRYSLSNPALAGTGVFYGSLITDPARLKSLPGPVLGIFGSKDVSIPVSRVKDFELALNAAGVKNEVTVYEGQDHAFVKNVEGIRMDPAQKQAWEQFLRFLKQVTAQPRSSAGPTAEAMAHYAGVDPEYLLLVAWSHLQPAHRH